MSLPPQCILVNSVTSGVLVEKADSDLTGREDLSELQTEATDVTNTEFSDVEVRLFSLFALFLLLSITLRYSVTAIKTLFLNCRVMIYLGAVDLLAQPSWQPQ